MASTAGAATSLAVPWSEVPEAALQQVTPANYKASKVTISNTTFYVLGRKSGGIGTRRLVHALKLAWPKLHARLPVAMPDVSIVDVGSNGFIGGGPFSSFGLGIYLGSEAHPQLATFLNMALDWEPLANCEAYLTQHYAGFDDPMQAYVNDMITHQLGHLYFGWGLTRAPTNPWFAQGLGLVYDRMVWSEISDQKSPIFDGVVSVWRSKFAHRDDINQKLVGGGGSMMADMEAGLNRNQSYGHGKSFVYLSELRKRLGETRFDQVVLEYISRPLGSKITYDDFLSFLGPNEMEVVRVAEQEFTIRAEPQ
jgi:hypothetical protein